MKHSVLKITKLILPLFLLTSCGGKIIIREEAKDALTIIKHKQEEPTFEEIPSIYEWKTSYISKDEETSNRITANEVLRVDSTKKYAFYNSVALIDASTNRNDTWVWYEESENKTYVLSHINTAKNKLVLNGDFFEMRKEALLNEPHFVIFGLNAAWALTFLNNLGQATDNIKEKYEYYQEGKIDIRIENITSKELCEFNFDNYRINHYKEVIDIDNQVLCNVEFGKITNYDKPDIGKF